MEYNALLFDTLFAHTKCLYRCHKSIQNSAGAKKFGESTRLGAAALNILLLWYAVFSESHPAIFAVAVIHAMAVEISAVVVIAFPICWRIMMMDVIFWYVGRSNGPIVRRRIDRKYRLRGQIISGVCV